MIPGLRRPYRWGFFLSLLHATVAGPEYSVYLHSHQVEFYPAFTPKVLDSFYLQTIVSVSPGRRGVVILFLLLVFLARFSPQSYTYRLPKQEQAPGPVPSHDPVPGDPRRKNPEAENRLVFTCWSEILSLRRTVIPQIRTSRFWGITCWLCSQPGLIFMQDNAFVHFSRKIQAWFRDMGIEVLEWFLYSPDLRSINHL